MCGISGFIDWGKNTQLPHLKEMNSTLYHRGPDSGEEELYDFNDFNVGFGHKRLAILDVSENGKQPMHYKNRFSIVFNGEIYNYREIKANLVSKKYIFSSASDTEVLLALYANKGRVMIRDLDGMFAFAIWDSLKNELFCARDRFGEVTCP